VIATDRTSVRYQATRPDDGALREHLKALAAHSSDRGRPFQAMVGADST
jgi:hypothetical protein